MNEPKNKVAPKRKLTLHRETLRAIDEESQRLEGVVGGLRPAPSEDKHCETISLDAMACCG